MNDLKRDLKPLDIIAKFRGQRKQDQQHSLDQIKKGRLGRRRDWLATLICLKRPGGLPKADGDHPPAPNSPSAAPIAHSRPGSGVLGCLAGETLPAQSRTERQLGVMTRTSKTVKIMVRIHVGQPVFQTSRLLRSLDGFSVSMTAGAKPPHAKVCESNHNNGAIEVRRTRAASCTRNQGRWGKFALATGRKRSRS